MSPAHVVWKSEQNISQYYCTIHCIKSCDMRRDFSFLLPLLKTKQLPCIGSDIILLIPSLEIPLALNNSLIESVYLCQSTYSPWTFDYTVTDLFHQSLIWHTSTVHGHPTVIFWMFLTASQNSMLSFKHTSPMSRYRTFIQFTFLRSQHIFLKWALLQFEISFVMSSIWCMDLMSNLIKWWSQVSNFLPTSQKRIKSLLEVNNRARISLLLIDWSTVWWRKKSTNNLNCVSILFFFQDN